MRHLRKLLDALFQRGLHGDGLFQAGAGNAQGMQRNIAFVQVGDELAPQTRGQYRAQRHRRKRCNGHPAAVPKRPIEQWRIDAARPAHRAVFVLGHLAAEQQRNRCRHEGQRQQHRAGQCQHHGDRHRVEHLAFDTGEREHRQIHRSDDAQAEQAGADHLGSGFGSELETLVAFEYAPQPTLRVAKAAQAVLHDDHRAIDDQTEIQRAKTHQIAGHATTHHAGEREQHRQRNHSSRDQRCAHIAQQQEQHHDHQQRAFDQVLGDGDDGPVHQRGAVVHRHRLHTGRQAGVGHFQPLRSGLRHGATIGTDEHEDRAEHHFAPVLGGGAGAQLAPLANLRHIAHADRHAGAPIQHNRADLRDVVHLPRHPHQKLLAVTFDIACADVAVVGLDRSGNVVQGKSQRDQARRIGRDMDLPRIPADGVDLGDARHVA